MAALPYFECLLLDLDGTLVDSRSLLISSIKCAVKRAGKRVPSAGEILRAYADTTSPGKILRQFKVYDPDEYWRHYVNNVSRIALFDKDIKWKLGEISKAGVRIGLVTSLPKDVVNAILQHFKLSRSFSVVKSYERRAPKWKLIDKAVRELKVDPYRSLYVGDMVADIVAAKRANKDWGIWAGIASWSRKKSLDLSEAEPDFIFQKFDDVTKLMLIRYGSEQDCFGPSESCYVPHEQYLPRRQKIGRESCRYCYFPADCLNCKRFSEVVKLSPGKLEIKRLSKQMGMTVGSAEWYYPKNYPRHMIENDDSLDARNTVGAFKKTNGEHGFRFRLALSMANKLKQLQKDIPDYTRVNMIVPVPTTFKKIKQRGYNPAEELAKVLSEQTGIPVATDCLRTTVKRSRRMTRYRYNWEDDKKRLMNNVRIKNKSKLLGKTILLVDDILTDGVTLSAYADRIVRALHDKSKVVALTFGLTRKERD